MARQPGTVRLEIAAPHVLPAGAGPGAVPPAPGPTYRIQINNILDNIGSESICICTDQNMRTDRCEYPPHNDEWFNQANGPPGLAGGVNGLQAVYNTANFVTGINDLTANNVGVTTAGRNLNHRVVVMVNAPVPATDQELRRAYWKALNEIRQMPHWLRALAESSG